MKMNLRQLPPAGQPRSWAFTLVEILIVVVILGILAAIAVPKLSNASQAARESSLKDDLRLFRTQITIYRSQHRDVFPGFPGGDVTQSPSEDAFLDQLTKFTDEFGSPSATPTDTQRWGPYITKMPPNPINYKSDIKFLGPDDTLTSDDSTGWLYQPSTGQILPNVIGTDSEGKSYSQY